MTTDTDLPTIMEYFKSVKETDIDERLVNIQNNKDLVFTGVYIVRSTTVNTIDVGEMEAIALPLYPIKSYSSIGLEGVVRVNITNPYYKNSYDKTPNVSNKVVLGLFINTTGLLYTYAAKIQPTREECDILPECVTRNYDNNTVKIDFNFADIASRFEAKKKPHTADDTLTDEDAMDRLKN